MSEIVLGELGFFKGAFDINGNPAVKPKGKGKQQGFTKAWLTTYDWLAYDAVEDEMHCKLCKKQRADGVWVTGTRNFLVRSVVMHITSRVGSILYTPCQRISLTTLLVIRL